MRFKSPVVDGFQAFAVTGTNTISFAITATATAKRELLGFAVRRSEAGEPPRKMPGFKVFRSVIPKPDRNTRVSTWDHPIQSFVWDDFTAKPDENYEYCFHPLRGTPQRLDRSATPIRISVRTEKLYGDPEHDVFFNRGVASSQLYAHRFGNKPPSDLPPAQAKAALGAPGHGNTRASPPRPRRARRPPRGHPGALAGPWQRLSTAPRRGGGGAAGSKGSPKGPPCRP